MNEELNNTAPSEVDTIAEKLIDEVEQRSGPPLPRNRAERRALAKKLGKKGRAEFDVIAETSKKLNYIELIQKLRELNKEKENEENDYEPS